MNHNIQIGKDTFNTKISLCQNKPRFFEKQDILKSFITEPVSTCYFLE